MKMAKSKYSLLLKNIGSIIWFHYPELLGPSDDIARAIYEQLAIKNSGG